MIFPLMSLALLPLFAAEEVPAIQASSVRISQDSASRTVKVSYTLENAPAVVTVDFLTNGVSIGAANFRSLGGEVNKVVEAGDHEISWYPGHDWAERSVDALEAKVTAWHTDSPPDYLVACLTGNPALDTPLSAGVRYYVSEEALPFENGVADELCKTDYLVMKKVKANGITFRMGMTAAENGGTADSATPTYYAKLTNDFYLGVYEFTQQQWANLQCNVSRPSYFTNDWRCRPVECTGGTHVRGYSDKSTDKVWPINGHEVNVSGPNGPTGLYRIRRITGLMIDLPTEAQWEFAARAGSSSPMPDGSSVYSASAIAPFGRFPGSPDLPDGVTVDRSTPPSEGGTAVVGSYPPNAWGFYDMSGNVMELSLNASGMAYAQDTVHVDPVGPVGDNAIKKPHIIRDGDWKVAGSVAERKSYNINHAGTGDSALDAGSHRLGFRVCLTLP